MASWLHTLRRNRLSLFVVGLVMLAGVLIISLARTPTDQWIEVPRDGASANRVIQLLERESVGTTIEDGLGVTYIRVPASDWQKVCALLERDSIENMYPVNIKRQTKFGRLVDVVRHPPYK